MIQLDLSITIFKSDKVEIVKMLLEKGAQVNIRFGHWTPLHLAAARGIDIYINGTTFPFVFMLNKNTFNR